MSTITNDFMEIRTCYNGLILFLQTKQSNALRAVYNPYSQQNRGVLSENFGIQLPLIPQKKEPRVKIFFINKVAVFFFFLFFVIFEPL